VLRSSAWTLSLGRLFANDFADGTLEQLLLSPEPLSLIVLGKVLAHWLVSGLPLVLLSPVLALQFDLLPAESRAAVTGQLVKLIEGNGNRMATGFLGTNILVNCIASPNMEVCAQAAAKLNAIIHDCTVSSGDEACYLISSVERIMCGCLADESHYAFLIPIMKGLIEKYYRLLRMNIQVPNIPLNNATETFYEDFKEYCRCDEWRIFMGKHVSPMREQYLAMTLNPSQMNMKIWRNTCSEMLMVSVHRRNRVLGESKIKFEVSES
jgi:hypothetical protein